MQKEITTPIPLLDGNGHLSQEGWARHPYWIYKRSAIKSNRLRIKEWDYYSVLSAEGHYGITITFSDLGYLGLMAICFIDLKNRYHQQVEEMNFLPLGKSGLQEDSDTGNIQFKGKKLEIHYIYGDGIRKILLKAPGLKDAMGNKGLEADITLLQPTDLQSLNIATSWKENRKAFYYNRKINCMPASGYLRIGNHQYPFDNRKDLGALDWGRGLWTYRNRWYWGSISGYVLDKPFGVNMGYGFSDRTPASENAIFFNGVAHKLEDVFFHFDASDYMKPWRVSSNNRRLELDFQPVIDRKARINLGLIKTDQHQVFGYFSGKAILDDGQELSIDRLPGFAEDVLNWW